jgi:hypothetical protein
MKKILQLLLALLISLFTGCSTKTPTPISISFENNTTIDSIKENSIVDTNVTKTEDDFTKETITEISVNLETTEGQVLSFKCKSVEELCLDSALEERERLISSGTPLTDFIATSKEIITIVPPYDIITYSSSFKWFIELRDTKTNILYTYEYPHNIYDDDEVMKRLCKKYSVEVISDMKTFKVFLVFLKILKIPKETN